MMTIVRLTVLEAFRRRLLWALVALTIVIVIGTAWGISLLVSSADSHGLPRAQLNLGLSQIVELLAFMYSFVLAMTAAFLGAPALASDLESGVSLAMLARPLRRSALLLGRWLGLAIVIGGYAVFGAGLEIAAVAFVSGYVPPSPVIAVGFLVAESLVLLTVAILLGSRMSAMASGAVAVVIFGLTWVVGVLGALAVALNFPDLATFAGVIRLLVPIDGLWRGVVYFLEPDAMVMLMRSVGATPNAAAFAAANPFYADQPPAPAFLAWAAAWLLAMLGLAVLSFRRREP